MNTKTITLSVIASAVFALMGAAPALAQNTNTPGIDATQQQIRTRIQQGVASGHLTQQEEQALYQREREIQVREIRMKRDGAATPEERQQLRQDLENMRAEVEAKLANRQVASNQRGGTPAVDNAQQRVHERIVQGVRSGHITQREADRLFAKEKQIVRREARFKSDGQVTRAERQTLRNELASLSNEVERKMANRQVRR
jgi:hypothetical protein